MRAMSDPGYVYRPWTNERRERARRASLQRLGTPPGYRIVFGVPVPEAMWPAVREAACRHHYRRDGKKEALWKTRAFILILLSLVSEMT